MGLSDFLSTRLRRFLGGPPNDSGHLLEFLQQKYADDLNASAQFEAHAQRMIYPHFRDRLLRIAEGKKSHVEWLRGKIRALGGKVPERPAVVHNGVNPWESLRMDLEKNKDDEVVMLEKLYTLVERTDPEIATGLRRMHKEDSRHREVIMNMLMRSDPQAFSVTPLEKPATQ